jgi:DNA-directed RNA polymerase specialized sigma24 family protein
VAAHLAQHLRRDFDSERLYERHAPSVYRYALAVLGDTEDAERVTRATFASANRALERGMRPVGATGTWLIRIAHALCRKHGGYGESVADELARPDDDSSGGEVCGEFEPLISRELDGMLSRRARARLHEHLRRCDACRAYALRQRALQAAVRALAALPLPPPLARH